MYRLGVMGGKMKACRRVGLWEECKQQKIKERLRPVLKAATDEHCMGEAKREEKTGGGKKQLIYLELLLTGILPGGCRNGCVIEKLEIRKTGTGGRRGR